MSSSKGIQVTCQKGRTTARGCHCWGVWCEECDAAHISDICHDGRPLNDLWYNKHAMGPDARKPVFGVSENVRFKPTCSATETN